MTQIRKTAVPVAHADAPRPHGDNTPRPIRSLRDWLDHLARNDRLALVKERVDLRHELAAYAKRLDGKRATLFPRPGGHAMPVISGLVSNRGWIAEAMGVEPPEVLDAVPGSGAQSASLARGPRRRRRRRSSIARSTCAKLLPLPTHNEHDSGPYIIGRPDDRAQSRDRQAERRRSTAAS